MDHAATTADRLRQLSDKAFDASAQRGVAGLAAWTAYLNDVRDVVNQVRGLEVADLVFLDGMRVADIVELFHDRDETISRQAVSGWLWRHGPARYLTVGQTEQGYVLAQIPVTGLVQTRREITACQNLGRRIAPARWELHDDVDPETLWHALTPEASRHASPPAGLELRPAERRPVTITWPDGVVTTPGL